MDTAKVLEYALAREYQGKKFFTDYADRLQNADAVGAFKTIAAEEQKHIDFILAQINAYKTGATSGVAELPWVQFFTDQASSISIEETVNESMVADLPVLRMAFLIERDFAEFYNMAAQKAEGETRQLLEMLARWESGHERFFKRMHDTLFEKYADMPWGG
jgi:rubrerythrin